MIVFEAPAGLLLLLLVPLRLMLRRSLLPPARLGFSSGGLLRPVIGKGRDRFLWITEACFLLALAFLAAALARPRWERVRVVSGPAGRDIYLLLDRSSSMAEKGLDPARSDLEVVKDAARRFVEGRPGDRIGLITFARFPEVRVPLTSDHEALIQVLGGVRPVPRSSPLDGTALGAALARAARCFDAPRSLEGEAGGGRRRSCATVLFTDGEENQFVVDPLAAARLCAETGLRVHAVVTAAVRTTPERPGLGSGAARIHEEAARLTGGSFARAERTGEVEALCRRIDAVERAPSEERIVREERPLLAWVLLPAVLLLAVERLLSGTVLGRFP